MGNIFVFLAILLGHSIFSSCLTENNREAPVTTVIGGLHPPVYDHRCGCYHPPSPPPPPSHPPPPPSPPPPKPKCPPPPPPKPTCPPPPPPPLPPPPAPPPPPPPPKPICPPPSPPPLPSGLRKAYKVVRKFSSRITEDPDGITKTWKGKNVCKYEGFTCPTKIGEKTLRLAGVNFNGKNLNGNPLNFQGFIEELDDLVFFHVNSNNFTGAIPVLDKLPYFYELDLSNNKLRGAFPRNVLGAQQLTFLDLRFNCLTGPLPPEVFALDLDVLFLNNNEFTGNLPQNLGNTSALYLTFANNFFTGPIPKSIGQANSSLVEVLFLNNRLSGCLPYEIGLLKIATVFDASKNQLAGTIPYSFGCLSRLQILNLSMNKLYGPIPEVLCKLKNLSRVTLSNNYFTQVGPECRKLIEKKVLDVDRNCILDLPRQKTKECKHFFSKKLSCPEQSLMTHIPCVIKYSSSRSKEASGEDPPPAPPPSRTYAALLQP